MAFVGILSQTKLLFGPLVIQLVWYILKQLFTSVSVKVVDIYLHLNELVYCASKLMEKSRAGLLNCYVIAIDLYGLQAEKPLGMLVEHSKNS